MRERLRISAVEKSNESKESPELFRASLGFDFVFAKDKSGELHPYCVEINGHDTGVTGVQDVPSEQLPKIHRNDLLDRSLGG